MSEGQTWRCPSCRDTVAPMGMCQKCGIFGLRYESAAPRAAASVPRSPDLIDRVALLGHEPRVGGHCDSGIYLECECGWDNFLDYTEWSVHVLALIDAAPSAALALNERKQP